MISYMKWNYVIPYKQEGVLTTASPILFLVKISWVFQGAVPPLCLRHTGSLLISYLSGEAVIIWRWASTMDNYPGKRIQTVEKILLSARGPECKNTGSQLVTAITSFYLPFFPQTPSCDLDQPPTKQFYNHSCVPSLPIILYLLLF